MIFAQAARLRVVGTWLAHERFVLGLLIALALASRLIMALTVPPWQGPDEPKHFEYVRVLTDKKAQLWAERRAPDQSDASPVLQAQIIASMVKNHYWEYLGRKAPDPLPSSFYEIWQAAGTALHSKSALSPLYYLLSALVFFPFQGLGLEAQLLVVRLLSVVLSSAVVGVSYLAAKEVSPEDRFVPIISAAFVAAVPMHAFIGGVVNTDNLASLLGSLVVLGLAVGFRRGFTTRRWAFILGSLALALITKRVAAGLLPAVMLAGAFCLFSLRGRLLKLVSAVFVAFGALFIFLIASGIAERLYASTGLRQMAVAYALNEQGERQLDMLLKVPLGSPEVHRLILSHLEALFRSFWGVFGWFRLPLSPETYWVLAVVSLICAIGFFVRLGFWLSIAAKHSKCRSWAGLGVLLVFLLAIVSMIVLAIGERLAYLSPNQVPQGRYLFVVIAPVAIVLALGARTFLPRRLFGTVLPTLGVVAALVALDLVVYTGCIFPFYGGQGFL